MKPWNLISPIWPSRVHPANAAGRDEKLGIALLVSITVHITAILVASLIVHENRSRPKELFFVRLIDAPWLETTSVKKIEASPEIEQRTPRNLHKSNTPPAAAENAIVNPQPAAPGSAPVREDPTQTAGAKPAAAAEAKSRSFATASAGEGDGSAAAAGIPFGNGGEGLVSSPGTAGGGGGTAPSGLGRGSGAPGFPAQQSFVRSIREAKPLQTALAVYPPMALRAGLESDVTLRIEVDAEGKVTRAEIVKSGGLGFDHEALKAVKQSRFEPAQRDGQNVSGEFTFIYRFRLRR
jgi:TonB family protein